MTQTPKAISRDALNFARHLDFESKILFVSVFILLYSYCASSLSMPGWNHCCASTIWSYLHLKKILSFDSETDTFTFSKHLPADRYKTRLFFLILFTSIIGNLKNLEMEKNLCRELNPNWIRICMCLIK